MSELNGLGAEVLLNHQGNLEGDRMLELAKIKSCQLADLFQTVNQRISVYKELARGFGNVQIIFKEALNGLKGLTVERLEASLLEDLLQKHLAKRGGKLIDQAPNAEIFVADDVLLSLKHLADLKSNLCFLICTRQILDISTTVEIPMATFV